MSVGDCRFSIPNRGELNTECEITDFAVHNGARMFLKDDKQIGQYWLAEGYGQNNVCVQLFNSKPNILTISPERASVGVRVVIRNVDAKNGVAGYGLRELDGRTVLTKRNVLDPESVPGICVYPNRRVTDVSLVKTLNKIAEGGPNGNAHLGTTCIGDDMKDRGNFWYQHKGVHYCRVVGDDKTPTEWFSCDPIPASRHPQNDEDIVLDRIITSSPFHDGEVPSGYLDPDEYLIGRLLRGLEFEFDNSTRCYAQEKKRVSFKVGDTVKIKCEGRAGVVKRIDPAAETATLSVENKNLTYRLEDLAAAKE